MKKKSIPLIIGLMSIALIGLMVIQVYWIRNAVTVKEAHFNRSVRDALTSVSYKLERIELSEQFKKRLQGLPGNFGQQDSINNRLMDQMQSFIRTGDLNLLMNPTFMLQDIFNKFYRRPKKVEDRIDVYLLDSLIGSELASRGIETDYEFGIFSPARNAMPVQKTGKYPAELLREGFSSILYPGDMFKKPDYLMVYFPNETRFLITQLRDMLIISLILILIIIFSFAYSVRTILKQKKISVMKNDFINNMTHEFKTPISTISLACEALSDKEISKTEQLTDSYIGVINEENNRLRNMAEKILQSASLEKEKVSLKKEQFDVHDLLNDAIEKIKLTVEKRGGKIMSEMKAGKSIISADRVHITNVFFNLLDNANKYSPETPEITIETANTYSGIMVSVKDKGTGISKKEQKKIFEKLYRIPTGNLHNVKGFGLGLSYVKNVVENHDGRIKLESEPGNGSKFIIYLPLEDSNTHA